MTRIPVNRLEVAMSNAEGHDRKAGIEVPRELVGVRKVERPNETDETASQQENVIRNADLIAVYIWVSHFYCIAL